MSNIVFFAFFKYLCFTQKNTLTKSEHKRSVLLNITILLGWTGIKLGYPREAQSKASRSQCQALEGKVTLLILVESVGDKQLYNLLEAWFNSVATV